MAIKSITNTFGGRRIVPTACGAAVLNHSTSAATGVHERRMHQRVPTGRRRYLSSGMHKEVYQHLIQVKHEQVRLFKAPCLVALLQQSPETDVHCTCMFCMSGIDVSASIAPGADVWLNLVYTLHNTRATALSCTTDEQGSHSRPTALLYHCGHSLNNVSGVCRQPKIPYSSFGCPKGKSNKTSAAEPCKGTVSHTNTAAAETSAVAGTAVARVADLAVSALSRALFRQLSTAIAELHNVTGADRSNIRQRTEVAAGTAEQQQLQETCALVYSSDCHPPSSLPDSSLPDSKHHGQQQYTSGCKHHMQEPGAALQEPSRL